MPRTRKRKRPKKLNCKPGYKQVGAVCQPLNRLRSHSPPQLEMADDPDAERKIQEVEDQIKKSPYEQLVIFNKNGDVLARSEGNENSVNIPREYFDNPEKLKGTIITHNHPSSGEDMKEFSGHNEVPRGQSFSALDVLVASGGELDEVRSVGLGYRYSIKPGAKGWSEKDQKKVLDLYNKQYKREVKNTYFDVMFGSVKTTRNGYVDRDMNHVVWRKVAPKMGWKYERTAIPSYNPKRDLDEQRRLKRKLMRRGRNGVWEKK